MIALLICALIACGSDDTPTVQKTTAREPTTAPNPLQQSTTEAPINLLLISLDTVAAEHLSLYGGRAEVPNLEKLAAGGVVFKNAYSHFPETAVSHWTMMTGALPDVHGNVPANGTSRYQGPTLAERLKDAGYQTAAFIGGETLTDRSTGLSRGFDRYDDRYPWNREDLKRPGKELAQSALNWIQRQQQYGAPYFAFVHFFDAHFPYTPSSPWDKKYPTEYTGALTGSDTDLMPFRDGDKTPTKAEIDHIKALYHGEISELDAIIAPLIAAAQDNNTLVVVTSDHGESFGHDYWFNHRDGLWDEITHVPLIMSGPKVESRKQVGALTGLIDVTPTILDFLNLAPLEEIHGSSARDCILNPVYRPAIFSMTDPNRPSPQIVKRTLQHKLIAKRKDGKTIMDDALRYAMLADPNELNPNAELDETFTNIDAEYASIIQPVRNKWQGPVPEKSAQRPPPSADEFERLKALGYVDGPAKAPTPK